MPNAIKAKDLKAVREAALPEEARQERARRKARKGSFQGLTFEDLNPPQRDRLLKAVAVKLGMIQDSEDS